MRANVAYGQHRVAIERDYATRHSIYVYRHVGQRGKQDTKSGPRPCRGHTVPGPAGGLSVGPRAAQKGKYPSHVPDPVVQPYGICHSTKARRAAAQRRKSRQSLDLEAADLPARRCLEHGGEDCRTSPPNPSPMPALRSSRL